VIGATPLLLWLRRHSLVPRSGATSGVGGIGETGGESPNHRC
jgi:hypothetical protein